MNHWTTRLNRPKIPVCVSISLNWFDVISSWIGLFSLLYTLCRLILVHSHIIRYSIHKNVYIYISIEISKTAHSLSICHFIFKILSIIAYTTPNSIGLLSYSIYRFNLKVVFSFSFSLSLFIIFCIPVQLPYFFSTYSLTIYIIQISKRWKSEQKVTINN